MLKNVLINLSLFTLLAGCGLGPDTLWEVSRLDGARPKPHFSRRSAME